MKPSEIESLPVELEDLYSELEMKVMSDIVRRVKINRDITRTADWQINRMRQLGASKTYIKDYIKETLELSEKEMDKMYDRVIESGYARDEKLYKESSKEFIPYQQNNELQTMVLAMKEQALEDFSNITNSLGFVTFKNGKRVYTELSEYYTKVLDNAVLDITSGAFDYNTVLKRTVAEMTKSGLRAIPYGNGNYTRRVETAVRTAVMTGVNQVTGKITEQQAEDLDVEYFEVTYHGGARPDHQEWQGKVYTMEQLKSVCGYGDVGGLKGANCYHDFDIFIPGISERNYTDEELEALNKEENKPIKYKDKEYTKYEALQQQRKLEATMRVQRQEIQLLKQGNVNEEDLTIAKAKNRVTQSEYIRFSKAMNLPQQMDRVTIDGVNLKNKTKVDILTYKDEQAISNK